MIGTTAHVVTFLIIALHPPFPVVAVMFGLQGFGHGIIDSAWNAWLADMTNAHQIMGFLHGFFGLGGVLAPLIATTMVTTGGLKWYHYYWVMVSFPYAYTANGLVFVLYHSSWSVLIIPTCTHSSAPRSSKQ